VLSSAGMIGLTGVSRAGFGICVNTLLMLNHDKAGLPVAAVFRGALAQDSAEEAVRFLRSVPHASGQHYAVADKHGVVGLECSAQGATVSAAPDALSLIHTNHPLASADIEPASLAILEARGRVADSKRRLGFLDSRIAPIMTVEETKRMLADRTTPICILPTPERPGSTFGSVVFTLSGTPQALFCLGAPDTEAWHEIPWTM
ncbi:MAG TPA: C45 family peptidase, partial [Nordella sp.]|nr:C45 family peptidase [Nordella sp.]